MKMQNDNEKKKVIELIEFIELKLKTPQTPQTLISL